MAAIALRPLLAAFTRIGLLSFGGPAGQIAVMHRILVEEKRWIGEHRFLHALTYCTLLPGPEAQQLCTYCGWLLRGTWGGIIAGALFVLPGVIALLACSLLYVLGTGVPWVDALFYGVKPAVVAIVLGALWRVSGKALHSRAAIAIAVLAFVALRVFHLPFPAVIAVAGLIGAWAGYRRPQWFPAGGGHRAQAAPEPIIPESALHAPAATWRRLLGVGTLWLALWLGPIAVLTWSLGGDSILSQVGWFFSTVAVVTFGGAYAVLPYIAQHAVETQQWLSANAMVDGLGLAESTPGPLIMVVQFVGFLAGHGQAHGMSPIWAGVAASAVTVWATFLPSYLWIFAGAPYAERLRAHPGARAALAAITAAVVGIIANLAVWFGLTVIFGAMGDRVIGSIVHIPVIHVATFDPVALILVVGTAVALLRFRIGLGWLLVGSILLGGSGHLLMR